MARGNRWPEIDELDIITGQSLLAMHRAVRWLGIQPEFVLVDPVIRLPNWPLSCSGRLGQRRQPSARYSRSVDFGKR